MNKVNSEIYADLSIIISMMSDNMKNKINAKFIKFIEENKSREYISSINKDIPLNHQEIRKETKEMMGIIYRDYLCDEKERMRMVEEEKIELAKIEKEKQVRYDIHNIFKEKRK